MVLSGSARNRQNIEGGMLTRESKLQPNNKPIPREFLDLDLLRVENSLTGFLEQGLDNSNSNKMISSTLCS